jgi:hypothetical protein
LLKPKKEIANPLKEDEQVSEEEIAEFIRLIKMYNEVMEYCSKNPKECE